MSQLIPVYIEHQPRRRPQVMYGPAMEPARRVTCPKEAKKCAGPDLRVTVRKPYDRRGNPGWWLVEITEDEATELKVFGYLEFYGNTYYGYTA